LASNKIAVHRKPTRHYFKRKMIQTCFLIKPNFAKHWKISNRAYFLIMKPTAEHYNR